MACELYYEIAKEVSIDPETGVMTRISNGKRLGDIDKNGYLRFRLNGKEYYQGHRIAWLLYYGDMPHGDIDHIYGKENGNGIWNLRIATDQQNSFNTTINSSNTSGYKGVCKHGKSFRARIKINYKYICLGSFKTAEEAAMSYNDKAKELFGEYARLNIVN